MSKGLYIIGTDTEVGKTAVSAGLMHVLLTHGLRAAYFKPVASGEIPISGTSVPADAAFVCAVSGFSEEMKQITPFSYADSVAPHLAARLAGRRVESRMILESLETLKSRYDVIIGEAAGGLAVPLDEDGFLQSDLIRRMNFPCLLVARAGLGTINHTLLTLNYARSTGLKVKGIVINRAGETLVERDNIEMIKKLSGLKAVFTLPVLAGVDTEKVQTGNIRNVFDKSFCVEDILALMEMI